MNVITAAWRSACKLSTLLPAMLAFSCAVGAVPTGHAAAAAPPGYFHVYHLDKDTYAISEPKYWQENVSYLLLGRRRALLFDTGPGLYSIRSVVKSLTKLPVIVIPSHLHFDHIGDLHEFDDVRLLDTQALRAEVHDGYFNESHEQYAMRGSTRYRVHGWIADGETIELGGRPVQLISTPGHTPNSVSLIESGRKRLFTGDLVNRIVTLMDVPGSDIHAMAASLKRLLALAPAGSVAYEAHSEKPIHWEELQFLAPGVAEIAAGHAQFQTSCLGGIPQHRYEVGTFPILMPVDPASSFPELSSATEELDWQAPCAPGK